MKDSAASGHAKYTKERAAGIVEAPPRKIQAARSKGGGGALALGFGVLLAGAVAASVRKKGVAIGWTYLAGVVVGSSGLFFLPHIAPELSSLPVLYTLTHGMPSWDLSVLGPTGHGNPLFFSALIPLGLLAVGYGMKRWRAPLAGLAVGIAAHLAIFAVVPFRRLRSRDLRLGGSGCENDSASPARLALRRDPTGGACVATL